VTGSELKIRLAPWLYTAVLLIVWEAAVRIFKIPEFFLPPPTSIAQAIVDFWGPIYRNSLVTLSTTMVGFGLAVGFGLVLGLVVGWSRSIYAGLYPLMIGFNAIPKVAVVPILVLWFGIGFLPAVLTAFLISFFPIVVNVATGLATTEPELEDVMRALHASKLEILWNVGLPRTMPYFFASLKVSVTLAFVGTVISETVASNRGIGNVMMIASSNFDVPLVFAGLLILAVLGVALYAIFSVVESNVTGWAHRKDELAIG
jgi:NitT/TauT family transport system permease protein